MKVLLVHTYYISRGGEDVVFENECNLLKNNGVNVDTLIFDNNKFTFVKLLFSVFNPVSFFKIYNKIKNHDFDVVHVHNWHFSCTPAIIIACKLCNVPLVHTLHNYRSIYKFSQELNRVESLNHNAKVLTKTLFIITHIFDKQVLHTLWIKISSMIYKYSLLWKWVNKYIVLTEASKKSYLKSYYKTIHEKFVVKQNFLFGENIIASSKDNYILYVGRLTEDKGLLVLLNAIKNTNYKLKIIGDGYLKNTIVAESIKNPNIDYVGYKDFEFVKNEIAKSKAVIFPSITEETFGMIIIEAFAHFTPVIGSDFSVIPYMINNAQNGYLFEKENSTDLLKKIDSLFALNEEEYSKLCINARNSYLDKFTPQQNYADLMNIYKSLK